MRVQVTWLALLVGCGSTAGVETDDEGFDPFTSPAGSEAADAEGSDGGASDCDDYRTEYPSGPYGNTPGAVIADLPGMVSPTGAAMSLIDIFQDRTKQVLVIANAFDT